jgi:8-oxo-dGTP diphosphatase
MSDYVSHELLRAFIREVFTTNISNNLHNNVPLATTAGGSLLGDEAIDNQKSLQDAKQAACCFIINDEGLILAVSRRNDPTMWGFPGGKIDPGEDAETAAKRELQEETGLIAVNLTPIFSQRDFEGYTTTTFSCEVEGVIDTDEEGLVKWVTPKVLVDPSSSPFVDYNKAIFEKLNIPF